MNKRLEQIMNGQEGSYVLPFFWPYEGHPELAEPQIEAIHACGIREICVEARPFEDFAGPAGGSRWIGFLPLPKNATCGYGYWTISISPPAMPTGCSKGSIRSIAATICGSTMWI